MNSFKKIFLTLVFSSTMTASYSATNKNIIYFHLSFPVTIDNQTESIPLNDNFKDLIISNFIAGALYAHLVHEQFPHLQFANQYLEGSLLGQLLQENLQTSDYQNTTDWINPSETIRKMLLASGQGGPYQLNDYSKRLENNIGLINFTALQKSLGYTIQDQDTGAQTRANGPASLDNKYFGPIAAAYFQYNDLARLQTINNDPWGPSAKYFPACMSYLENTPNNFLDMIVNATYNAGPWSNIETTYIQLCGTNDKNKIAHINDYTLTDAEYQQAIGTNESVGSTFILYPRQIRFYLDELYNNPTGLNLNNSTLFSLAEVKTIFTKSMATLAYVNMNNQYNFITKTDAAAAFDSALTNEGLTLTQSLDVGSSTDRNKFFNLLEDAISHLSQTLNIHFSDTTEENH